MHASAQGAVCLKFEHISAGCQRHHSAVIFQFVPCHREHHTDLVMEPGFLGNIWFFLLPVLYKYEGTPDSVHQKCDA
jgi:hypothetical protein